MAKPWARYEIDFINHPKFLELSQGGILLWIEGKNYCDKHHTDGMIPRGALRTFRFCNRARVAELKQIIEGYAGPLWEEHAVGFKMHDYLNHNDCREEVLKRLEDAKDIAELRQAANAKRQQAHRDKRKAEVEALRSALDALRNTVRNAQSNVTLPGPTETETETTLSTADKPPTPTEDRVAAFYQWFAVEYKAQRHSDYLVHFKADTPIIWKLLQSVPMERLKLLATLMLTEKIADDWIQQSDRSIKILKIKLNWLNERLSAWEATRANGTQG